MNQIEPDIPQLGIATTKRSDLIDYRRGRRERGGDFRVFSAFSASSAVQLVEIHALTISIQTKDLRSRLGKFAQDAKICIVRNAEWTYFCTGRALSS